tara:strand:- start:1437 stop:1583 length:147 start_codon:yes stop_codon:yes gene_type:complete
LVFIISSGVFATEDEPDMDEDEDEDEDDIAEDDKRSTDPTEPVPEVPA